MSPAYIAGVKENLVAQALVVFEKFHVVAHVNAAIDEMRRAEQRLAPKAKGDHLNGQCGVYLKNPVNHTERKAAHHTGLLKRNLATVKAHQKRRALQEKYIIADLSVARRKLRTWCGWVHWIAGKHLRTLFANMRKCAVMITRHLEGILGHWLRGTTNAFLEGPNSVFSAVKQKACGSRVSVALSKEQSIRLGDATANGRIIQSTLKALA